MALLAVFGCASTPPAPGAGVDREPPPARGAREVEPTPLTTPVRASFEYAPGTVSYVVASDASITEIDSIAGAPRTFRETARLALTITPETGFTLVTTTGSIEGTTAAIIQPYVDTLRVENVDTIAEPRMPICGRDTVPPMHVVTLLPPVPHELREGLRWQRRYIYGSCQGPIPLRVERTDSYTVTGRATQIQGSGVTISRNSSFVYAGAGVEAQHNVRIAGSGSGQATFVLDATAGRLHSGTEKTNSEIRITASGRTRRFSQSILRTVTPS